MCSDTCTDEVCASEVRTGEVWPRTDCQNSGTRYCLLPTAMPVQVTKAICHSPCSVNHDRRLLD